MNENVMPIIGTTPKIARHIQGIDLQFVQLVEDEQRRADAGNMANWLEAFMTSHASDWYKQGQDRISALRAIERGNE